MMADDSHAHDDAAQPVALRVEPSPRHQRRSRRRVFVAATTLTDGPDINGSREDVYVVRLPEGTISRVSLNSSGVQPDVGDSILPSISADGRWIACLDAARRRRSDDEQPSRSNREKLVRQVYLRDAIAGRTTRVTRR